LARLFNAQIEYVLFDPNRQQAWIKYPNNPARAKSARESYKKKPDQLELQCKIVQEPIQQREICEDYTIHNKCSRGMRCNHKHSHRATERGISIAIYFTNASCYHFIRMNGDAHIFYLHFYRELLLPHQNH